LRPARARWLSVAFVLGAATASCDGGSPAPSVDAQFVAFGHDFAGFDTWPSQVLEFPSLAGSPHAAGARTVFVDRLPPTGATEFPVGTMIVKRTEADGQLLARAKRGGTYNSTGAVGWEWFELTRTASGVVSIKWRGFGPPLGEAYGGNPKAGCNGCHALAANNDYVLTPGIVLAGAGDGGDPLNNDAAPDGGADSSPDADSNSDAAPDGDSASSPDGEADSDAGTAD
jgi:hypothetical protein